MPDEIFFETSPLFQFFLPCPVDKDKGLFRSNAEADGNELCNDLEYVTRFAQETIVRSRKQFRNFFGNFLPYRLFQILSAHYRNFGLNAVVLGNDRRNEISDEFGHGKKTKSLCKTAKIKTPFGVK